MENGKYRLNNITLMFRTTSAGNEAAKSGKKGDTPRRPYDSQKDGVISHKKSQTSLR